MKVRVSVIIPVRNEAENLARCLGSVSWADEVWVVDSQSTDRTAEIAESLGARFVQFHYQGGWPKKKSWALENLPVSNEWLFLLDADETLPPGAEAEIREIVSRPGGPDGYWINRRFQFLGRWMKHAYYPNWNLRLFRSGKGRFEKITEAETRSGDVEIHEHVLVDGPAGRLRCEMDHFAFPTVEVFVEKHNRYSNWEARVARGAMLAGSETALGDSRVALRRSLKQWSYKAPLRPLLRFLYVYLWQRGFLDGREGYYFARLHAMYEFLCVAKEFELRKTAPGGMR
ncbi:MAG TPA: glycosyltransferase family 2 protein [Chthoniobacteraceae bacterium]|jgi:glycosyltransferase involved in cell wall biosynthesis|nr:glycosyltransferase family 2 protein [Chthoniobacteraceae bacterium]